MLYFTPFNNNYFREIWSKVYSQGEDPSKKVKKKNACFRPAHYMSISISHMLSSQILCIILFVRTGDDGVGFKEAICKCSQREESVF